MLSIVRAVPADATVIHAIQMRAFAEEGRLSDNLQIPPLVETVDSIERLIRTQTVLVAREGNRIVGSARGLLDGAVCTVRGVFVEPSHQGLGIGASLLLAVEQLHPDVERFELTTNTLVPGNVAFYERRGYRVDERTTYGEKIVLAQMSKPNSGTADPPLVVREDDLSSPEVQALVAEHLAAMHGNSPPGHVHALAIESLRSPDITFWSAWRGDRLCGCGALKELDSGDGEVKSMRTRTAFLRQGVGQAVLDAILRTAQARNYGRLYLETGSGSAFAAAHALYRRNGFGWCGPFSDYAATDFNVFMVKLLPTEQGAAGPG